MGGKGSRKIKASLYKQKGKQSTKRISWFKQKSHEIGIGYPPFINVYLFSPPPDLGYCLKTGKQSKTFTTQTNFMRSINFSPTFIVNKAAAIIFSFSY